MQKTLEGQMAQQNRLGASDTGRLWKCLRISSPKR